MRSEKSNKNEINFSDIETYTLSLEKETRMLDNCIFVFDTSALFNIYYFSQKTQNEIFNKIFNQFSDRLWIPNHVQYEYLINREKTMMKPLTEKYGRLQTDQINPLKKKIIDIENNFKDLKNKTHKNETHPYMKQEIYTDFEKTMDCLKKDFDVFFNKIEEEISVRKSEIESLVDTDTVFEEIKKHFKSGRKYSYDEIDKIMQEGKKRYADKIPPGYEDEERNKKVGIQKYGDLIIWNQIIEFAKQEGLPIILISNDLKSDWCYSNKINGEPRIEKPKEDLIREIKDKAGVSFWMYSFPQFLHKAKEVLKIEIESEVIEEAQESVKSLNSNIVYNKYYVSFSTNKLQKYETYLKFYENGTVYSITLLETPGISNRINTIDEDKIGFKDKYEVDGNKIIFENDLGVGVLKFEGTIMNENEIIFDISSDITGIGGKSTYMLLN